jgi:hypothetical protein
MKGEKGDSQNLEELISMHAQLKEAKRLIYIKDTSIRKKIKNIFHNN